VSVRRPGTLLLIAAWVVLVVALSLAVPQGSDGEGLPEHAGCAVTARSGNGLVLCLDRG
jgi:hypothetical protein